MLGVEIRIDFAIGCSRLDPDTDTDSNHDIYILLTSLP
jgi:hypothetical protein